VAPRKAKPAVEVVGFVGIGLDNTDDHKRVTTTDHFLLVGGSKETHERMQEIAIRVDESLRRRGKPTTDLNR
jgi:hypothetical protein